MKKILIDEKYKPLMEVWIEDLRMNPGLQGAGELYNGDNQYCCLGRLCVVAGMSDKDISGENLIQSNLLKERGYNPDIIPETFVSDYMPEKDVSNVSLILTTMNDGITKNTTSSLLENWGLERRLGSGKYTFPEIADFLEQRIEYV